MRVSPVGMWFCEDADKVHEEARKSAECTHNHPEGIKGAQIVAKSMCHAIRIFDGLMSDKKKLSLVVSLCEDMLNEFGYDQNAKYEDYKNNFDETCQGTIPPVFDILRRSLSFEDAIRMAVSLGADADTLGAIVGSIAEHIWGIPSELKDKAMAYLPEEMRDIVRDFYLAMENKDEYKPETKYIERCKSMMFWKLGAGNMSKFLSMEDPMPCKDKKATAKDWQCKEFQMDDVSDIPFHYEIPEDKMKILMQGHIPEAQEDHWFMYCDKNHIRYYRSWTGDCAFEAHFHKEKDKYVIDHLFANYALNEFGVNGNEPAKALFLYLIYSDIEGYNSNLWLHYLKEWEQQYIRNVETADEEEKKKAEAEDEAKKAEDEARKKEELAKFKKMLDDHWHEKWIKECDRKMITRHASPYLTCVMAGTQYIKDQSIFCKFEENDMLTLKYESNKYDKNAIAFYFKGQKVGYVPRHQNKELARLLKNDWEGVFLAYVSKWEGFGTDRKVTVEIMIKLCLKEMTIDFDDSSDWWAHKMVETLDSLPRHSEFDAWSLWTRTYNKFDKKHITLYDRPWEFIVKTFDLCLELIKERYNISKMEDPETGSCSGVRFFRFEDEYNRCHIFDFDKSAYLSYNKALEDQLYYSTGGSTGTLSGRTTPEKISKLEDGEVFVFGSNSKGHHNAGAAYAALKHFGAVYGQGDGLQGQSYAISTMEGLIETARNVNRFIKFAAEHQELTFMVTPIGCGIAGFTPLQIAPLFRNALILPNVNLPRIFWEYFWMVEGTGTDYFEPGKDWEKWQK